MKILALDTSGPVAAMAVMEDLSVLAELSLTSGRKHGERLAPALRFLLSQLGLQPSDLSAYAVGLGPGSFTGLRAGLAFVKGLALAEPRPVIGVSSLEALASAVVGYQGLILPVIDAKRGEVFAALFRAEEGGTLVRERPDHVLSPQALSTLVQEQVLVLGDGLARYGEVILNSLKERARLAPQHLWSVRASVIARLAWPRLLKQESDPLDLLVPLYLRASV